MTTILYQEVLLLYVRIIFFVLHPVSLLTNELSTLDVDL